MKPFILSVAAFALLGSLTAANAQSTTMVIEDDASYGIGLNGYSTLGQTCSALQATIHSGAANAITDTCTTTGGATSGTRTLTYGQYVNFVLYNCFFSITANYDGTNCTGSAYSVAVNGDGSHPGCTNTQPVKVNDGSACRMKANFYFKPNR